jgi:hypothetical protein
MQDDSEESESSAPKISVIQFIDGIEKVLIDVLKDKLPVNTTDLISDSRRGSRCMRCEDNLAEYVLKFNLKGIYYEYGVKTQSKLLKFTDPNQIWGLQSRNISYGFFTTSSCVSLPIITIKTYDLKTINEVDTYRDKDALGYYQFLFGEEFMRGIRLLHNRTRLEKLAG